MAEHAPFIELMGATATVRIAPAVLLAPMEGITDPIFRQLVCPLGGVGGACTEFLRVTNSAFKTAVIAPHLRPTSGLPTSSVPTAVQFMASGTPHLAASAGAAQAAGAAWIDLNFGCPAPTVCGHGAGSALLCDPPRIAAMIAEARRGTSLPVTAKIRSGIDHDRDVERLVLTCADAGAAAITLHGRVRAQTYAQPSDWTRIARGVSALRRAGHRIALIGNGSIDRASDVAAMHAQTGCDATMIGRAALADPFIFRVAAGGAAATRDEARAFVVAYANALRHARGAIAALPRVKQLIRWWQAGELLSHAEQRANLLRGGWPEIAAWLDQPLMALSSAD